LLLIFISKIHTRFYPIGRLSSTEPGRRRLQRGKRTRRYCRDWVAPTSRSATATLFAFGSPVLFRNMFTIRSVICYRTAGMKKTGHGRFFESRGEAAQKR
jgi:hypothetical protein